MAAFARNEPDSNRAVELHRATELLGGKKVFQHSLDDALDVHEMLLQGMPHAALTHLIDNLSVIRKTVVLGKGCRNEFANVSAAQGFRFETAEQNAERSRMEIRHDPCQSNGDHLDRRLKRKVWMEQPASRA